MTITTNKVTAEKMEQKEITTTMAAMNTKKNQQQRKRNEWNKYTK